VAFELFQLLSVIRSCWFFWPCYIWHTYALSDIDF